MALVIKPGTSLRCRALFFQNQFVEKRFCLPDRDITKPAIMGLKTDNWRIFTPVCAIYFDQLDGIFQVIVPNRFFELFPNIFMLAAFAAIAHKNGFFRKV